MGVSSLAADCVELLCIEGSESLGADVTGGSQRGDTPQRGIFVFSAENEGSIVGPGYPVLRFNCCARLDGRFAKRRSASRGFLYVFDALFGEFEQCEIADDDFSFL
jgi:hypothetical protein